MRKLVRVLAVVSLSYAGIVAFQSPAEAGGGSGTCCSYSSECTGTLICCDPTLIGAFPCSATKTGYCLDSCKPA